MKVRIYYHHTDAGGIVYYANYLKFLEEARTEFFEQRGFSIKEFINEGILFVVSRQEIDYKAPSFYGDTLDIETCISDITPLRLKFEYTIKNQSHKIVVEAKTVLVCVDKNLKPKAIPEDIKIKLLPS